MLILMVSVVGWVLGVLLARWVRGLEAETDQMLGVLEEPELDFRGVTPVPDRRW